MREKRPERFWRYLAGDWAALVLSALVILWALISPASF
jgi:hypothetical protein